MKRTIDAVGGRAVQVALELGLFQNVDERPDSLRGLAARCGVAERGLRPLLYRLTSLDLLEQAGELFSACDRTRGFLAEEWPALESRLPRAPDWDDLGQAVRTGRCVRPPIEGERDGGQFFTGVVGTLFQLHWPAARHLATRVPEGVARVLDLGAGSAVWSLGLMTQREEVRAVAVDHAKVLAEITTRFLTDYGVADRYELRPGSYHELPLEAAEYDLVYLGHVLHSEGLAPSRRLLKRAHQALVPGGSLVVAEMLGSEPRGDDYHANLFDLNMLMFTEEGMVFTRTELEDLGREAGFVSLEWVHGPGQYPLLLAAR